MVPPEQDPSPQAGDRRPPPEGGEKPRGGPSPSQDQPNLPSLSEQAAAYAVLGCDLDALGAAVARHWGLGDELLQMIRNDQRQTWDLQPDGTYKQRIGGGPACQSLLMQLVRQRVGAELPGSLHDLPADAADRLVARSLRKSPESGWNRQH